MFCDSAQMAIFGDFLHSVLSVRRVQHVSDLHPKFELRPHHVCKYSRHPIWDGWEQARTKKKERKKKKPQEENIMSVSATQGDRNN